MKPLTLALVAPFDYQPFHSIRLLCELLARELSAEVSGQNIEVIPVTPFSFFGDLTRPFPALHRSAGLIERLTLSPLVLRAHLAGLESKARKSKRRFAVLLSDQSLGILGNALSGFKILTFVSDLIALRSAFGEFPSQKSSFGQRFNQRVIFAGLSASSAFLCPSRATADDLARYLPSAVARTTLAPLCLNAPFEPLSAAELSTRQATLWRTQKLLPRSYFLCVGSSAWYKNRLGVLHLCAALKKLTPTPPALVLAGAELTPEESAFAREHALETVVFSNLPAADLQTLYCGAEALLMPSFAEGFGWPALEALACGTPIVITDNSSLVEHFSSAAALVLTTPAPADLADWSAACAPHLLELLTLAPSARADISSAGLSLAATFKPATFRAGLLSALEKVIA